MPAAMPSFWNGCAGPTTGACISTSGRLAYTFLAVASAGPGARRSARGRGAGAGRGSGRPGAPGAHPAGSACWRRAPRGWPPARARPCRPACPRPSAVGRHAGPAHSATTSVSRTSGAALTACSGRNIMLSSASAPDVDGSLHTAPSPSAASRRWRTGGARRSACLSDPHPLSLRASMVAARCRGSQAPRRGLACRSPADSAAESAGCCDARCLHGARGGPCLAARAPPVHHTAGLVQVHPPPPGQPVGAPALARASSRGPWEALVLRLSLLT